MCILYMYEAKIKFTEYKLLNIPGISRYLQLWQKKAAQSITTGVKID